jgi:hypothetical protein
MGKVLKEHKSGLPLSGFAGHLPVISLGFPNPFYDFPLLWNPSIEEKALSRSLVMTGHFP